MKKRIVSLLLAMVLVLGMMPATVSAATVTGSGTCSDTVTWTQYSDGTLVISGTGEAYSSSEWDASAVTKLVIGDGITKLGSYLTYSLVNLTSVEMADTVTQIDNFAFCDLKKLESVKLSANLVSIGISAFSGSALTSIVFPASLKTIGTNAFSNSRLTSVTIPATVTCVESGAFQRSAVQSAVIGSNNLNSGVFNGCTSLETVTFSNGVTKTGEGTFSECTKLATIQWGTTLTTINRGAFSQCSGLRGLSLPNTLAVIEENAFSDCTGLTEIVIPDSVTSIGGGAFYGCTSLKKATLGAGVSREDVEEKFVFNGCAEGFEIFTGGGKIQAEGSYGTVNWKYYTDGTVGFSGSGEIPESVAYGTPWQDATKIVIYDGVTSIGSDAFNHMDSLTTVEIAGSVKTIGTSAFSDITSLTSVTIGSGVETIGDYAFNNCGLTGITIPDSVISLGKSAFFSCPNLEKVVIGAGITTVQEGTFSNCASLTDISFGKNVATLADGAFSHAGFKNLTIPGSVTTMGEGVFAGCTSLETVTFGEGFTTVGLHAFWGCTGLKNINWGSTVTTICDRAFQDCTALTILDVPTPVTSIGQWAFGGCTGLISAKIGDTVTQIGENAFRDCKNLGEVYIGKGLKTLGEFAFLGNNMTKLVCAGDAPVCELGGLSNFEFPNMVFYDKNNPTWTDEYIYAHARYIYGPINFVACDVAADGELIPHAPTQEEVYQTILALKSEFPEGMQWDEKRQYGWKADSTDGFACAAFAMQVSDLAFGALPSRTVYLEINMEDLRVGDILSYWPDESTSHAVVILEVHEDHVVIVEGNYNGTVHWGRTMTREEVESAYSYQTRYYEPLVYTKPDISTDDSNAEGPSFTTNAAVVARDDNSEDTLDWVYYADGTVVISGTGEIPTRYYSYTPWENAKKVVIMKGITGLADLAFAHMETLESVEIAGTVKYIGESAFQENRALKEFILHEGIEYIDESIFATSIGNVHQLKEIIVPDSVKEINDNAFYGCQTEDLKVIVLGAGLKRLGDFVFSDTPVETIVFRGDAPECTLKAFALLLRNVTIYYPANNPTWTERFIFAHESEQLNKIQFVPYTLDLNDPEKVPQAPALPGTPEEKPSTPQFTDVPQNKYYAEPVAWAVQMGITNGKTATEFCPDEICTRGQVMTFIWRANGCPEPTSMEHNFTDLNPKKFYYKAVLWAVEQGITTGKTATTFEPDSACTRSQVVTFLWRAAGQPEPNNMNNFFNDVQSNAYYYKAVLWAVEEGITTGKTATTFQPKADCIRAQIVTFLYRDMVE